MEVKILSEEENKLFNRREIRFEAVHEGEPTPRLVDVKIILAQKLGVNQLHIIIDGFKTLFGIGRTIGNARVYDNINDLKDYEPEYLLKRNKVIGGEKSGQEEESSKETKETA